MPTSSPRLAIPLPDGTDTVSRAAVLAILNAIDSGGKVEISGAGQLGPLGKVTEVSGSVQTSGRGGTEVSGSAQVGVADVTAGVEVPLFAARHGDIN